MFESACEDGVRTMAAQERESNEKARKQLVIECEKKAQSVVDGMMANARAAYAEGDREVAMLRAELTQANQRLTSKNQEHLRSVEQLHMKIMLLESRQSVSSPGGGAQVFDMAKDDKLDDQEGNFDKIEREAKAKLGSYVQVSQPQLRHPSCLANRAAAQDTVRGLRHRRSRPLSAQGTSWSKLLAKSCQVRGQRKSSR